MTFENGMELSFQELKNELDIVRGNVRPVTANKLIPQKIFEDGVEIGEEMKPIKEVFPAALDMCNAAGKVVATSLLNPSKFDMFKLSGLKIINDSNVKIINNALTNLDGDVIIMFSISDLYLMSEDI